MLKRSSADSPGHRKINAHQRHVSASPGKAGRGGRPTGAEGKGSQLLPLHEPSPNPAPLTCVHPLLQPRVCLLIQAHKLPSSDPQSPPFHSTPLVTIAPTPVTRTQECSHAAWRGCKNGQDTGSPDEGKEEMATQICAMLPGVRRRTGSA